MTSNILKLHGPKPGTEEFANATLDLIKATHEGVVSYLETQKMPGPIDSEMVKDYHRHLEEHSHSYRKALNRLEEGGVRRSDDVAGLTTFFLMVALASSALPSQMHSQGLEALIAGVIGMYEVPSEAVPPILMSIMSNVDGVRVIQVNGDEDEGEVLH